MQPTIIFCFAGRKANMELQVPLIRRVLDLHPEVEYHIWNVSSTREDDSYLKSIKGERITVINNFGGWKPGSGSTGRGYVWEQIYRHYAADKSLSDHIFVKIDDDVIFFEAGRFSKFVTAVSFDPSVSVLSAKVINNGACTPL